MACDHDANTGDYRRDKKSKGDDKKDVTADGIEANFIELDHVPTCNIMIKTNARQREKFSNFRRKTRYVRFL